MLLMTLQFLGNQGALRVFADKFGRTESTVHNAVGMVCQFFFDHQSNFIQVPRSRSDIIYAEAAFQKRSGFPGVVGALDGSHMTFHPKKENMKSYQNRLQYCSFVLMAIVQADRQFSYTFVGSPGKNHDSFIWKQSSLQQQLQLNCDLHFDSRKYHLIGDSAFPLTKWCIVPYKRTDGGGQLSRSKKLFNYKLSSTRIVVEQAFGDLKNRFRRTQDLHQSIDRAVNIVVTSCVLHNICIRNGDIEIDGNRAPANCNVNREIFNDPLRGSCNAGVLKRDMLCDQIQPQFHNRVRAFH
ncbi:protein ALP1-like [Daphnia magna]|uniref:protein ALP1-like n=1 Tax=Daphnia magna TaxID=35525 RepID=UPI001E1BC6C9|nr:protein ALP1-like [Daphnia magna]XP_045035750.1 protein ALP1-like [Daphnia magna]